MKHFWRTIAGKTIAFACCLICLAVFAASVLGAALMLDGMDYNFYLNSEEALEERFVSDVVRGDVSRYVMSAAEAEAMEGKAEPDISRRDLVIVVLGSEGQTLLDNRAPGESYEWGHVFHFRALLEYGYPVTVYSYEGPAGPAENEEEMTVYVSMPEGSALRERCGLVRSLVSIGYGLRYWIYAIAAASLGGAVCFFICLMSVAARRPGRDDIVPGPLNRVPFDVIFVAAGAAAFGAFVILIEAARNEGDLIELAAAALGMLLFACMALGTSMSMAARIKQGTLIKGTVTYKVLALAWRLFRSSLGALGRALKAFGRLLREIPLVWKAFLCIFAVSVGELFLIAIAGRPSEALVFLFTIWKIIECIAVLYIATCLKRLQNGARALAMGDLSHLTDTRGMILDFKACGEDLNSIAKGMAIAVEDRVKSERMKTELITNVSHDIKTPLTSIINYAGLIASEECGNENHAEYSEVLVRQSERLKRLLEDLVEASRASTGDMEVSLMPCDASVFITQAAGEFSEKLEGAGLSLMTRVPDGQVTILADGRRMQRVFDNLMNNICKYSQPGTRVWLTLEREGDDAVISFKNTSKEPLDMTEEELLERFTRGDHSRNTEGSGLGLSIAKSLTELQKGSFRLSVDGDLFKAVLSFPLI
ncbi:MAG: HAMP domain-containing histidine kinase [Firmicutes bacterium]|nr:HAMP domain-containing histidine kinase [Bacillota bacterium]MBQ6013375.1 HAMP domain-containing histidine kinase [Bacillota bacterium]MBQ6260868.1 HAMP domain-containing histidine kinase [Bacillota bacterium]MBR0114736.1 HAMP domain-containing histidine kinase [Bacillota bacterium]